MRPIHNIPKNLVYAGSKQNVVMTAVDGRILYENGNFTTVEHVERGAGGSVVFAVLLQTRYKKHFPEHIKTIVACRSVSAYREASYSAVTEGYFMKTEISQPLTQMRYMPVQRK